MTDPQEKHTDEDRFAEQLERLHNKILSDADPDDDAIADPSVESPNNADQGQPVVLAEKVLGLIQRVRKSKESAQQDADQQETAVREWTRPDQPDNANAGSSACDESMGPEQIGRFKVRRKLGQGGYGLVFLAHDPLLDRELAIKVPRPQAVMDPELRSRFIREARAAAGLNHANIVPVFESGIFDGVCYIASAYCAGPTLAQWVLNHDRPVDPSVAAKCMVTLADAVQHAHSRGIIHRDLKPDNVLVAIETDKERDDPAHDSLEAPLLRITDFGLASDLEKGSDLTRSGSVMGTPGYMSPEQTDSTLGATGPAMDVYGLGAILYFMLCKKPPFEGGALLDMIKKVQEQPPVSPRKIRSDVPHDLESICLKSLEKRPGDRYQTASELQGDLLRFQQGLPVLARRPSFFDRSLMWCRRRPAVSALAATLLAVLAMSSIALGVLLVRSNSLKRLSDKNATKATESANLARIENDRTRQALHAMTSGVASNWLGSQRELTKEQKEFLVSTIEYYREFAAGNTDDPEDQFWVAQAEHRLAQLLSRLGQYDESLASSDRAISQLDQLPADWEPAMVLMELAETLHDKDGSLALMGRMDEALPIAKRAVDVTRELVAADPTNLPAQLLLTRTAGNLGSRFQQLRNFDEALATKKMSVLAAEQMLRNWPDDQNVKRSLGINAMNLAVLLSRLRQDSESKLQFQQSLEIRKQLAEADPESAIYQYDLAFTLYNFAALENRIGDRERARSLAEQSTAISRSLVEQYPMVERYRRHLIASLRNQSAMYNDNRMFAESRTVLAEMNSIAERSIADFPDVAAYRIYLANGKSNLAVTLAEQGQYRQAIELHDEAIEQLRDMVDQSIDAGRATRILEFALENRATALGYVGRHEDAIADWDALIPITRPEAVNTIWLCRATSLVKQGKIEIALADVERVLAETMALPEEKRNFLFFYNSACVHSLISARVEDEAASKQHAKRAIELLRLAIDAGLTPISNLREDPELEPLHGFPEYQAIVKE